MFSSRLLLLIARLADRRGRAGWPTAACLAGLAALAAATPVARAQTATTWTGSTSSDWGTPTNWTNNVPTTTGVATFASGSPAATILLGSSRTLSSFDFQSGAAAYTVSGTADGFLFLQSGGGITVNAGVTTDQIFETAIRTGWNTGSGTTTFTNNGTGLLAVRGRNNDGFAILPAFPVAEAPLTWSLAVSGSGTTELAGVFERNADSTTSIVKNGSGTLVILGGGTAAPQPGSTPPGWYQGSTTINAGTLQLGNSNALGSGTGAITFGGGTLRYSGSNAVDYSPRIRSSTGAIAIDTAERSVTFGSALPSSNSGGLTKLGSGTLTLSASNSFTGNTTVDAGTLALAAAGSFASSPVITVASGGTLDLTSKTSSGFAFGSGQTLAGSGSVTLPTSGTGVSLAGFLAPGAASAGTLAFTNAGAFSIESAITGTNTGRLQFGLGSPGASDLVTVASGTLAIGSGFLNFDDFDFTPLGGFGQGTYTLFSAASLAGTLGTGTSGTINGLSSTLQTSGNTIQLVVVPEPAGLALAGLGIAAAAWVMRAHRGRDHARWARASGSYRLPRGRRRP